MSFGFFAISKKPKLTLHFGTQIRIFYKKFYTGPLDVNCEAGRRAAGREVCLGPRACF